MKASHYVILFFIIAIAAFTVTKISTTKYVTAINDKIQLNRKIDNSVDAAVNKLIEVADDKEIQINLDESVENFYNALYTSFGVIDSEAEKEKLNRYIPVIAITQNDGFFVQYKIEENGKVRTVWTPKILYTYSDKVLLTNSKDYVGYTVNLKLDDTVQLMLEGSNIVFEAKYDKLASKYKNISPGDRAKLNSVLQNSVISEKTYYESKNQIISECIQNTLAYYVNQYNDIARSYGISYTFELPSSANSDIANNIDSVAFIALFQGYPYAANSSDVYNRFCIGAAQIRKKSLYYVQKGADGLKYYHTEDCELLDSTNTKAYNSQQEAAESGALPCENCKP